MSCTQTLFVQSVPEPIRYPRADFVLVQELDLEGGGGGGRSGAKPQRASHKFHSKGKKTRMAAVVSAY